MVYVSRQSWTKEVWSGLKQIALKQPKKDMFASEDKILKKLVKNIIM
jgi:hypothetical protein